MATETDTGSHTEHGDHPSVGQYVEIGVILAVLTAIEVALFFADIPREVTIPALLILTAMKFILVVMWFMHLRFDHRIFRRLFVAGAILAAVLFAIVLLIQFTNPIVTQV
jgi:cytochrome c oxidase subunit IV